MIAAVIFDVGGVLLVPDVEIIGKALRKAGVEFDDARLAGAHYRAVHYLDDETTQLTDRPYDIGYLTSLGLKGGSLLAARQVFEELGKVPAIEDDVPPSGGEVIFGLAGS